MSNWKMSRSKTD